MAVTLYGTFVVLGVVSGIVAHEYGQWDDANKHAFIMDQFETKEPVLATVKSGPVGIAADENVPDLRADALTPIQLSVDAPNNISVGVSPFAAPSSAGPLLLNKLPGRESLFLKVRAISKIQLISDSDKCSDIIAAFQSSD